MQEFIIYVFLALLCAMLYGYIHICIGQPAIDEYGIATHSAGMIGSFFGAWICRAYARFEAKETARIRAKYLSDYRELLPKERQFLIGLLGIDTVNAMSEKQLLAQLFDIKQADERRTNPFKILWLCPPCSLFWFSHIFIVPAAIYADKPLLIFILSIVFFPALTYHFFRWLDK
jgi:hypothetical protein